jgi:cobalt-zinc-cadmium efflux system membrane fusion protein
MDKNVETTLNTADDDKIILSQEDFSELNIVLGSVESIEFPKTIKVNGVIEVPPQNQAVISAVRGGYIKSAPPIVGSAVSKGDVIVTIENPEFIQLQQDYQETAQQLKYFKYEYERHSRMKAENVISEKNFLESENEYKTAKARSNGLKKQLELINISPEAVENGNISSFSKLQSPISGIINRIEVSKGSYVSPETEILEIVNNDHIHLELMVYEKDILKVKKGQKIKFKIPESSQEQYEAEVFLVGNAIDKNRTVRVHAHVKNEDGVSLMIGMFVEAEIQVDTVKKNAVLTSSIIETNGKSLLTILDEQKDNKYYFRTIDFDSDESFENYTAIENMNIKALSSKIVIEGSELLIKLQ